MNKKNLTLASIIILAVILISVTIFAINNERKTLGLQEPKIEKVYVGFETEEELDNFNREDAVKSLQALIVEVGKAPGADKGTEDEEIKNTDEEVKNETIIEENKEGEENKEDTIVSRLEMLNNEDTDIEDVLTKKAIDKLYFSEEFGKDKFNRQFAASSLLIYYDIIRDSGSKDFSPVIQSYDEIIYLDNKFMTAHIPLDIFIGSGTGVAFEMQYINGEWQLNPYTAMMSLNMMGILNQNNQE